MRFPLAHVLVAVLGFGLGIAGVGLLHGDVRGSIWHLGGSHDDQDHDEGDHDRDHARCENVSCADGVRDGTESDVDCGRDCRNLCAAGQRCRAGEDCSSQLCEHHHCAIATCEDGIRNGGEADVDCGGPCAPCGTGASCAFGEQCASGVCQQGSCSAPSCFDRVMNGEETGVDCGGNCERTCAAGDTCAQASDCESGSCVEGHCGAVSCPAPDGGSDGGAGPDAGTPDGGSCFQDLQPSTATVEAALTDALSGAAVVPSSCAGTPIVNCTGGNPADETITINPVAIDVTPADGGTFDFTATLGLTSTPIIVTEQFGTCATTLDTSLGASPTVTFSGSLRFASLDGGTAVQALVPSQLSLSGLEPADVTFNGGSFFCGLNSLGLPVFVSVVGNTLEAQLMRNACLPCGSSDFSQCPAP